jgi:hypothetical protein
MVGFGEAPGTLWVADVLLHTHKGETAPCALFLGLSFQRALLAQR